METSKNKGKVMITVETTSSRSISTDNLKISYDILKAYDKYHKVNESRARANDLPPEYVRPCERLMEAAIISSTLASTPGIKQFNVNEQSLLEFHPQLNSIYNIDINIDYSGGLSHFMNTMGETVINFSHIPKLTGFFSIKIKDIKNTIPVRLQMFNGSEGKLKFRLYKEEIKNDRSLYLDIDDIESISLITLITIRGLKREIKSLVRSQANLTDSSIVGFDASLI